MRGGVSLTICEGEYVAIVGASGSGKSTLMNMIGLLDRSTSGSYRIRREVSRLSRNRMADLRNREIGFVFQSFNLLARTSARRQCNCRSSMCGRVRTPVGAARIEALQRSWATAPTTGRTSWAGSSSVAIARFGQQSELCCWPTS